MDIERARFKMFNTGNPELKKAWKRLDHINTIRGQVKVATGKAKERLMAKLRALGAEA